MFLVFAVSGLFGCGSGGGSGTASAPPDILGQFERGEARQLLLEQVEGSGSGLVEHLEADSASFREQGSNNNGNGLTKLLPSIAEHTTDIPTEYSRYAYIRSAIDPEHDPGRYLLWGHLALSVPQGSASYAMRGDWTCAGCEGEDSITTGEASGELSVDFSALSGSLELSGEGLRLGSDLSFGDDYKVLGSSNFSASYNNIAQAIDSSEIRGGLFGDEAEEAGLLFGFSSGDKFFSGAILGERPN